MHPKKTLIILALILPAASLFSQQAPGDFTKEWKVIDSLIEKNAQPKTALARVTALYARAKKQDNDPQAIKALVYRLRLIDQTTDDNNRNTFLELQQNIALTNGAPKAILQSILASSYWNFLQANRYRIYQRTNTVGFSKDDPATWTIADLNKTISELFLASVDDRVTLSKIPVSKYTPVVRHGNTGNLRPTLFDLLTYQALSYFKNDERNISKPAYSFTLDDSIAFAPASAFSTHRFTTRDTQSIEYRALVLYQQLLSVHAADTDPDALIDADIARIQYIYQISNGGNKDDRYKTALEKLIATHKTNPVASQAVYLLAESHATQAAKYDALKDTANRYEYLKAEALCRQAIAISDSSEGGVNGANLLKSISARAINTQAETVNVPDEPFRMLLTYRNITKFHYRILRIDQPARTGFTENTWDTAYWVQLKNLPALRKQSAELPDTRDHQTHRVELKVDALPAGEYALLASADSTFTFEDNILAVQYLYVSSIAYIRSGLDLFVVDRKSGAPLSGAGVQTWYQNNSANGNLIRGIRAVTDKQGFVQLRQPDNSGNTALLEITKGRDRLFLKRNQNYYYYPDVDDDEDDDEENRTFLFTDRSIYRPGQTVFFKGITIAEKNKKSRIVSGKKSIVYLQDANAKYIDSITLTTNDFGSYSGKFTLPSGTLNGSFAITNDETGNNIQFRVEEYKRPKFSVEIKKPEGIYRLSDTVRVQGIAKGYAGNTVPGAAISYRVVRTAVFPMFMDYIRIWPPYRSAQVEISSGTATTDANGKFFVAFAALPDQSIPKDQEPTFTYQITADVTDVNGETRSGSAFVTVGYRTINLDLQAPKIFRGDTINVVRLSSTNMNGLFVKSNVTLTMEKLHGPDRLLRERYWEQPDQFIMTRTDYEKAFPEDAYSDESDVTKWPVEKKMLDRKIALTNDSTTATIDARTFAPGTYIIRAITRDSFNTVVTNKAFVEVAGSGGEMGVGGQATASLISNVRAQLKTSIIDYGLQTNVKDAYLLQEIKRKSGSERSVRAPSAKPFENQITLDKTEAEAQANVFFVKNNRLYSSSGTFAFVDSTQQLQIEFLTFRDKMLPGEAEKWKIKISGYRKDKAAAELLSTMYDASLDQFEPHTWPLPAIAKESWKSSNWEGSSNFRDESGNTRSFERDIPASYTKIYDQLLTISEPGDNFLRAVQGRVPGVRLQSNAIAAAPLEDVVVAAYGSAKKNRTGSVKVQTERDTTQTPTPTVQPRTNLNETAFFFPDLHTDTAGNIEFSFTAPEALTSWKWMLLAHAKDLRFSYAEKTIVTQKELMVQPNVPRFVRQGDSIALPAKLVNLSGANVSGRVSLELIDATTGKNVDGIFANTHNDQPFSIAAGQSIPIVFNVHVPSDFSNTVTYKIIARAGAVSDGEQSILPVLSNRMLVTESLPLFVNSAGKKIFTFDKLAASAGSKTLRNHGLTVEFSSNPAWYVVQALPYLAEGTKENAEAIFNRYYANAVAVMIANSSPKIKAVLDKWATTDTGALQSNLQKNEELKSVLLAETPWVLEAKSEAEQKRNIATLFKVYAMAISQEKALQSLRAFQLPSGGFPWYPGGQEDRYMTQYILTGMGRLKKLGALNNGSADIKRLIQSGVAYLDRELKNDYDRLRKLSAKLPAEGLDNITAQYLYMRSLFPDQPVPGDVFVAYNYYRNQSKTAWLSHNSYTRGMMALALARTGDPQNAKKILVSLKETAIHNPDIGMYWKDMSGGYYWYQSPVETQAMMIEAFSEIANDDKSVTELKTWLLTNKQTNNWKNTRATADACYALLLQGGQPASSSATVAITLGKTQVGEEPAQAGTGYFQERISADKVDPSMGRIEVNVKSSGKSSSPAWGAVYWQYFEDLDKITPAKTPLQLTKKLFVETNSDRGPQLQPIGNQNTLHVGDKVRVRIELRSDRDMEYVHMKDMRAACLEPADVLSNYKYQDGLGYYQSTRDASTDFFFARLPRGVFVFEYTLFVTAAGRFDNGITSIQCMYAPEFSSHSEGIKLQSVAR